MEPLGTMLLGLFTWLWYLTLYVFQYMHYVPITVLLLRAGIGIRIALLLYCVISVYNILTSRAMRAIRDVSSVLLSCHGLGYYLWKFINNHTWSVGETGKDDFPQLFTLSSSFSPVTSAFENFQFPLDIKESLFLLLSLPGLLSAVYTTFRIKKELSREVIQRSAIRVDG